MECARINTRECSRAANSGDGPRRFARISPVPNTNPGECIVASDKTGKQAATPVAVFTVADAARFPAPGPAALQHSTMKSGDGKFETGYYQVGPEHEEYVGAGYENDEFCYILTGSVVLTAADGTVNTIGPGDAVTIPRGWKGRWDSDGYTKLWVIYHARP